MNLVDIVKRKDHFAVFDPELVSAHETDGPDGKERCIDIKSGGELLLKRADLASALRTFPHAPGWIMRPTSDAYAEVEVQLVHADGARATLCRRKASIRGGPREIQLAWPISAASGLGFSLSIKNTGPALVRIAVGPCYSARRALLEILGGFGVEVGPGMNPQVLARVGVNVQYVEIMSGEEWSRVYAKKSTVDGSMNTLWSRYVSGSAHDLKEFEDESLDFVFSNHVFEHLPNPLGVLINWFKKLKRGGVVAGVVPDARYTFDLRQPLSTLAECEDEYATGCYQLERRHYERWCQYTAPYSKVEDLVSRKYAVHAKYYSADTFRSLLDKSQTMLGWSEIFVIATRNGKDFGFLLRK